MARTHKSGLDYFSFDIDFFNDEKVEFVAAKYGNIGELVVIKLLCRVYRNGYFLKWGEDECLLFSKRSGDSVNQDLVDSVVIELLERDFFCKKTYKKYSILTSNGIQRRFLEATKRRKSVDVAKEYFIADTTGFNVNIISLDVDINLQRKVKETKGKESKVYGEFKNVTLTDEEYRKLEQKFNNTLQTKIEALSGYMKSKGKSYKDHYATILTWARKDDNVKGGSNSGKHNGLNEKDYSEGIAEDGTF